MNQKRYKLIGVFGGTFDPIHNGHLAVADHLLNILQLQQVQFIPCGHPPHRATPQANPQQRLAMLELALAAHPSCVINKIELKRQGCSYMADTLAELYQQHPDNALGLIIGVDVLAQFNQWHQWQQILELSHLIVVNRPDYDIPHEPWLVELLQQRQCHDKTDLLQQRNGRIFLAAMPPKDISASNIRHEMLLHHNIKQVVPTEVATYIEQHQLYQDEEDGEGQA